MIERAIAHVLAGIKECKSNTDIEPLMYFCEANGLPQIAAADIVARDACHVGAVMHAIGVAERAAPAPAPKKKKVKKKK